MPTKFVNILETSKLQIRGQYLDSVSYVLLHFLALRLFENLAPGMTSVLLKFAGTTGVRELLMIFQGTMGGEHKPDEWHNSLTVPLYKRKGDALQCGKYRGVQGVEIVGAWHEGLETVLNERLKQVTNVGENQFGFRVLKSTAGAIFIV